LKLISESVRRGTGIFLILTLMGSIVGLSLYITFNGVHWLEPVLCVALTYLISWVISSGYHRYFAHKSYVCHPALKFFYLIVGAAGLQQSALVWASDHRHHHRYVDKDTDPYSMSKGFWWAHWGWLFAEDPAIRSETFDNAQDLAKDKWIQWQDRYWVLLSVPLTIILPLAVGFAIGRPVGMLLWAGLFRIVLTHHTTFTINSVAHYFGRQPYTDENSARDVWWLIPFLCGENYHNYHHRFPGDYRNGVHWYQYDPSKWLLWLLAHTPLVKKLHRVPQAQILRARLEMDLKRLQTKLDKAPPEFWQPIYQKFQLMKGSLLQTADFYSHACQDYFELKKQQWKKSANSLQQARQSLEEKRRALKQQMAEWKKSLSWAYRTHLPSQLIS
jgi:Fatty-acid desaturase